MQQRRVACLQSLNCLLSALCRKSLQNLASNLHSTGGLQWSQTCRHSVYPHHSSAHKHPMGVTYDFLRVM